MVTLQDYAAPSEIAWCPGCGNFGILRAVRKALADLQIEPHRVLIVSGIGQAGKFPHYLKCHTLNELHGRTLPAAVAARIANHELIVMAVGGDGDGYGEGGNHFVHAMHRNVNVKYMVHNNQVYGLTKGQASPTSDRGFVTKTTPAGAWDPVNPIALAIASNTSFVARSFAGNPEHLATMLKMAIQHKGFSLIDVLQPCISFNRVNTFQWYQQRVYQLDKESGYDPANRLAAFAKSLEWGERIPIGLIYKIDRPVYEESLPALKEMPLVKQKLDPMQFEKLLDEFI
ncbi:MAG: thiamine pyrophosphate-dependent enzyme [Dehalococcoidia bacterium]|nr:thiamine pyrophosphate-dependent enzyme [Dehalococcoidia bacterium]